MYNLALADDGWITLLPGAQPVPVRAQFRPVSRAASRAAGRAALRVLQETEDADEAGDAFSAELIRRGLIAWEGIGDRNGAVDVTPASIEGFLANAVLFEAADDLYVKPFTARSAEKNVSSPSQDGTSEGQTPEKPTALPAGAAAKSARTGKTPRKPTKAATPGT